MAVQCNNCGEDSANDARFCGSCGQSLREPTEAAEADGYSPTLESQPPPSPAEVLSEETSGRSRQLFVRGLDETMIQSIRDTPGVTDVRTRVATLEEIFVACTTEPALV